MPTVAVRVIPNSSCSEIVSFSDGILKVKVMEPADKNRANKALLRLLAKKVSSKRVSLASGAHSRDKIVEFDSALSFEEIIHRLLAK